MCRQARSRAATSGRPAPSSFLPMPGFTSISSGATARYLAFKHASPRNAQGVPTSWISTRLGGTQIDYADESPAIRRMFTEALARQGVKSGMDDVYAAELQNLPPKAA